MPMVLYTTMPLETVLEGFDQVQRRYLELEVDGGVRLLVEQTGANEGRIVRLISTDPQDYLQECYQPGRSIKFIPQLTD